MATTDQATITSGASTLTPKAVSLDYEDRGSPKRSDYIVVGRSVLASLKPTSVVSDVRGIIFDGKSLYDSIQIVNVLARQLCELQRRPANRYGFIMAMATDGITLAPANKRALEKSGVSLIPGSVKTVLAALKKGEANGRAVAIRAARKRSR